MENIDYAEFARRKQAEIEASNPIAQMLIPIKKAEQEKRRAAIAKRVAPRSKAIVDFEAELIRKGVPFKRYEDKTANGLTRFILDFLDYHPGMHGQRINIGGVKMANGNWRTSGSTKGVSDVVAVVRGKYVGIEVKAGRDKIRATQEYEQQQVRAAGGIYEIVHNADEAVQVIMSNY